MATRKRTKKEPIPAKRVGDQIILDLNGVECSIGADLLREALQAAPATQETPREPEQDKFAAAGLDLRAWVLMRHLVKQGWNTSEIAAELGVSRDLVVEWLNQERRSGGMDNQAKLRPAVVKELEEEFSEQYRAPEPKKRPSFDARKVAKLMFENEDAGPKQIAQMLKADEGDFLWWYNHNLRAINQAMRPLNESVKAQQLAEAHRRILEEQGGRVTY